MKLIKENLWTGEIQRRYIDLTPGEWDRFTRTAKIPSRLTGLDRDFLRRQKNEWLEFRVQQP